MPGCLTQAAAARLLAMLEESETRAALLEEVVAADGLLGPDLTPFRLADRLAVAGRLRAMLRDRAGGCAVPVRSVDSPDF